MCHMPLTGVINYVFAFIFADAGFSHRTRLVIEQSWSHSHSLNYIHDSFLIRNLIFQNFSYIYMAVVAHYSKERSALLLLWL